MQPRVSGRGVRRRLQGNLPVRNSCLSPAAAADGGSNRTLPDRQSLDFTDFSRFVSITTRAHMFYIFSRYCTSAVFLAALLAAAISMMRFSFSKRSLKACS